MIVVNHEEWDQSLQTPGKPSRDHCLLLISQYGIELALAEDNLESYLETHQEREDSLKLSWTSRLTDTFIHIHTRTVFVDDNALQNILILGNEQLKLADFGQSILSPPDIDIASANENDLTVQIEILHLG